MSELAVDKWKNGKTKSAVLVCDFLYDLFGGNYDEAILAHELEAHKDYMSVEWSCVEGMEEYTAVVKCLKTRVAAVDISASDAPPPVTARTLKRMQSDSEEQNAIKKDRDELWLKAAQNRKRFVAFTTTVNYAPASLSRATVSRVSQATYQGKQLEKHRAWVFSCDLNLEAEKNPWSNEPGWSKQCAQAVQFVLTQAQAYDVIMLFDGRSRSCRRQIEKLIDEGSHAVKLTEMHIHYKQPESKEGRRVAFQGKRVETFYVMSNFPLTMLKSVERTELNALGERSSHDAAYSGVESLHWARMPKISRENKQTISGGSVLPPSPSAGVYDDTSGVPLFWQERKPELFYKILLQEWKVKNVIDLTPGSGTLARTCMTQGWQYLGLCWNAEQSSWLQNVLNRRALQIIATSGTALFEQELADMIKEHFKELLDELHDTDLAVDDGINPIPYL